MLQIERITRYIILARGFKSILLSKLTRNKGGAILVHTRFKLETNSMAEIHQERFNTRPYDTRDCSLKRFTDAHLQLARCLGGRRR